MTRLLKKEQKNLKDRVHYFIKRPTKGNGRATFAIVERHLLKDKSFRSEQLDSINQRFLKKELTLEQAETHVQDILDRLNKKEVIPFNSENRALLQKYWDDVYESRTLVDRKSAWNRLARAVDALDTYSLLSAGKKEIQDYIDKKFSGNKQREIITTLNQLFNYFKTGIRLRKAEPEYRSVRYITKKDLPKLLAQIKNDKLRLMHEVAFGTGLRAGELFGVLPKDLEGRSLFVDSQINVAGKRTRTKNKKIRYAFVLSGFELPTKKWLEIPLEERLLFRKRSIALITKKASKKALGRTIVFHDLRHSYAIHMISNGINLKDVADAIGDSMEVTEKFYSNPKLTQQSLERLSKLI